jgi:hypothetical protein
VWKLRGSGDTSIIPLDEVVSRVKDLR